MTLEPKSPNLVVKGKAETKSVITVNTGDDAVDVKSVVVVKSVNTGYGGMNVRTVLEKVSVNMETYEEHVRTVNAPKTTSIVMSFTTVMRR